MEAVTVIVETPKGKGLKYDFDPKTGYFCLKKIMPAGMVFPFDFGFIPGTLGEDGDPIDVMVISELETFPGCAMECRIIGAIQANQTERTGESMRNDRYIAVPLVSALYADIDTISQLPKAIGDQIERFFINYNEEAGKKFEVLERSNAKKAIKELEKAQKQEEAEQLIQIYLPLYEKEEKPFPGLLYKQVKKELTDKFGGLTMYTRAPAKGFWKADEHHTSVDDLLIYEVLTTDVDEQFWSNYKKALEKQFKQEEIMIRCSSIRVL
jgi:inorganic pyrophosphatase